MNTNTQPRQPSGTPVGGQFAGKQNPECRIDLLASTPTDTVVADHDEAIAFLMRDGNLGVPGGRYGRNTKECAEVAWRVEQAVSAETGEPITRESLDSTMGMVVNGNDDVQYVLDTYATDDADQDDVPPVPEAVFDGYQTAALWSGTDEDGDPLDRNFTVADIDEESAAEVSDEVADFWRKAQSRGLTGGWTPEQFGHDFHLTRNGHGSGFWDRGHPHGDELTEMAHTYGEKDLVLGDDEKLHFE
jgi:hypothetical protein